MKILSNSHKIPKKGGHVWNLEYAKEYSKNNACLIVYEMCIYK